MLNYGEPQILELMKNTLPSRLYPILFPIDNLRDAITMAKWVMIKEKIDRQKTSQSSTGPFMRVNKCSQSSEKSGKKGMTFDVIETLERHSDSIDKLTSLVSKIFCPTTDHLAGIGIEIEEIIFIITEIIDPAIEIGQGTATEVMIDNITIGLMKDVIIIDQITEGETIAGKTVETDKTIEVMTPDRDMEIEVRVGIDPEIIVVTEPEVGIGVETEMDKFKTDPELCQMREEDQGLGLTLE